MKLGEEKPEVAKGYLRKTNINRTSGGSIGGVDAWIRKMEEECRDRPHSLIEGNNLQSRRFCRLYWSVEESIDILIKTENKLVFLSTTDSKWNEAWNKYKNDGQPWGKISEASSEQAPQEFKDRCKKKSKELVNDDSDEKYRRVTSYCTRNKTIKDSLDEKGVKLLENTSGEWKKRMDEYNEETYGARFKEGTETSNVDEFKKACQDTVQFETTTSGYRNFYSVVERYCAINKSK